VVRIAETVVAVVVDAAVDAEWDVVVVVAASPVPFPLLSGSVVMTVLL